MNQQESELKPCPFCGCVSVELTHYGEGRYSIDCKDCQASGPLSHNHLIAIHAWNNRYQEKKNEQSILNAE